MIGIWNVECGISNMEYRIQTIEYGMWNVECETPYPSTFHIPYSIFHTP
jgi:hypothetical protein